MKNKKEEPIDMTNEKLIGYKFMNQLDFVPMAHGLMKSGFVLNGLDEEERENFTFDQMFEKGMLQLVLLVLGGSEIYLVVHPETKTLTWMTDTQSHEFKNLELIVVEEGSVDEININKGAIN